MMIEWKNLLRGFIMGTSDVIPGVSGGTMALILGIYTRLIDGINKLTTKEWKSQLGFFIPLGIGMGTAILALSNVIEFLLADYPEPTFSLFIGLILGTIPFLMREADYRRAFTAKHYAILAAAAAIVIASGFFQDDTGQIMTSIGLGGYVFLFFAGWLASSAMLLPGVSGSFVLLIIGAYPTVIAAVSSLNFLVIIVVGLGIVVGILIMSKFIHFLLRHHSVGTYATMIGLLIGSLFVVFPGIPGSIGLFFASVVMFLIGLGLAVILGQINNSKV